VSFPFYPIPAEKPNGISFLNTVSGETLHFDSSWWSALDRVHQILWDHHIGNYTNIPSTIDIEV